MSKNTPFKIAIAGLGTVGTGTIRILQEQRALIAARSGRDIELVAVSARDKKKKRPVNLAGVKWVDSPAQLAALSGVDAVVELMGGSEGAARQLVEAALKAGKHVITANKALIAHHGMQLAALAEKNNVTLAYEASVAGGIPIIRSLRAGLAANGFEHLVGILNGTCNFILTRMWDGHLDFERALEEAQHKGYAEADPTFDVEGIDTAHKLSILTTLAYGTAITTQGVYVEGIRSITIRDMEYADELGYVIKLLGIASRTKKGVLMRVHPALVPKLSTIGRVSGAYNGIIAHGHAVGRITLEGMGAGEGATASSVVGDIMDIAQGAHYKPFTVPVRMLKKEAPASMQELSTSYYLRLGVMDKPGVLADITDIFRAEKISLRSFIQHDSSETNAKKTDAVQVIMTTHPTLEKAMQRALKRIASLKTVLETPRMIRIEEV